MDKITYNPFSVLYHSLAVDANLAYPLNGCFLGGRGVAGNENACELFYGKYGIQNC